MKIIPSFLVPFFTFKIVFTVWLGSFLTYINIEFSSRLDSITTDTKAIIFYFVTYSVFILSMLILVFIKKNDNHKRKYNFYINEHLETSHLKLSIYTVVIIALYSVYILLIDRHKLPIMSLIQGDLLQAAYLRMLIQTHELTIGAIYISKIVFFMSLFLPVFLLIKLLTRSNKTYIYMFIIALPLSIFNLVLDLQKSYVMLLLILLLFVYFYFRGLSIKLMLYLVIFFSVSLSLMAFIMEKEDLFEGLIYITDRMVFGQNQGMYYLYQYYNPNLKAVFSDFYFSSTLGLDHIKPDVYILDYIYKNLDNLVNANTYYLGEAWSYFGYYGLFFSPIFISINIMFYIFLFYKLLKYDYVLFWSVALIFFSTLPIDQSLQFIMYQKYLVYFLFFCILPLVSLKYIAKVKWIKNG